MLRRTSGLIVAIALSCWAFYQLAWHPTLRHEVLDWGNLWLLVPIAILAAGALVCDLAENRWVIGLSAAVAGAAAAAVGATELTAGAGWIALALVVVAVLWLWIVPDYPERASQPAANAPANSPAAPAPSPASTVTPRGTQHISI